MLKDWSWQEKLKFGDNTPQPVKVWSKALKAFQYLDLPIGFHG